MNKRSKQQIYEEINIILSKWNPLEVDEEVALDEYIVYVPMIYKELKSKDELRNSLHYLLEKTVSIKSEDKNSVAEKEIALLIEALYEL